MEGWDDQNTECTLMLVVFPGIFLFLKSDFFLFVFGTGTTVLPVPFVAVLTVPNFRGTVKPY